MEQLNQLFLEAGTLMLAGMVFVFAFLGLLIIFINTVLASLAKRFPDSIEPKKIKRTRKSPSLATQGLSPSVVAAISSAVTQYRHQHKITK